MTDCPRFEKPADPADEAHKQYHGGRFVDLALRAADRWRARRMPEAVDVLAARALMPQPGGTEGAHQGRTREAGSGDPLVDYDLAALAEHRGESPIRLQDRQAFGTRIILLITTLGILAFAVLLASHSRPTAAPENAMPSPRTNEPSQVRAL